MTTDELMDVCEAVAARTEAWVGDDSSFRLFEDGDAGQFAIFAGTDLPAGDVLAQLELNAEIHVPCVEDFGPVLALKSVALLGFLFGFECGRRSE